MIGVLAMSVDLGEFNVLEKQLPAGHEVVLIDLRESTIDGQPRRGLILHHQAPNKAGADGAASFVGTELLARIDKLLEAEKIVAAWQQLLPHRLPRRGRHRRQALLGRDRTRRRPPRRRTHTRHRLAGPGAGTSRRQ